jgi:hypothetical protein
VKQQQINPKNKIIMAIKITSAFKKIKKAELENFELAIGYPLPSVYKQFLLKHNGGRVDDNFFKTINGEIETNIQFMFGITDEKNYDLMSNYAYFKTIHSGNLLPIAMDGLGNLILLTLDKENESVLLWIHDTDENPFFLIANDFRSFFNCTNKSIIEQSAFDVAISRQDVKYFRKRMLQGEHINHITDEFGQPATIVAALRNKVRLLKFFYVEGARMELTLFSAASNGHLEASMYLLSIGMDPDERNIEQNNDTALIKAAYGGCLELVKELVAAGADINAKDKYDQTVLRKANWSNNKALVDYLKNLGAQ